MTPLEAMFGVRSSVFGVENTFGVRSSEFEVEHQEQAVGAVTPNTEHRTPNSPPTPNTERRTPNILSDARVSDARQDLPPRGDKALAAAEGIWLRVERLITAGLPRAWNPFAYTGALAGFTFMIATVTGIALLFWYDTSVHTAYASVEAMQQQPWGSGLIRALHRYSSDACVLFAVIHAIKIFLSRRFTGARWLAWVTGIIVLGLIWLDGWLGYWLTWDQRAQAIAVGTAHVLDALPIFPEPVARTFLTNGDINSLIFFAVFFAHVLLPIPIGAVIWIHLARVRKPRFLPSRKLMWLTLGVLTLISLLVPATLAAPADMAVLAAEFDIDWFYLLPLFLTDRVDGVTFWIIMLGALAVLCSLPFVLGRARRKPALVNEHTCTGCTQCVQDCPYDAISMVQFDGKVEMVALVDPARCVSCGVCVGACDSGAMGFEELERRTVRYRIRGWLNEPGAPRPILFACADGAGGKLRADPQTGLSPDVAGWRVIGVPCASWVHRSLVELISRKGGKSMIAACTGSDPRCRMGGDIALARAENRRSPGFDPARIAQGTFRFVQPETEAELREALRDFAEAPARAPSGTSDKSRGKARLVVSAMVTGLILSVVMVALSQFVYVAPDMPESMFVVAFKHAGAEVTEGEEVSTELKHLQGMKQRTRRLPVRLRITVDGEVVHEEAFEPRGVRGDSASVGTVELALAAGPHEIEVALGDTASDEWIHVHRETVTFESGRRRVLQFEEVFAWDGNARGGEQ